MRTYRNIVCSGMLISALVAWVAGVGWAQNECLTLTRDESSMERIIEQNLKDIHQLSVAVDTQPLNRDDNDKIIERGVRVQLFTGVNVPADENPFARAMTTATLPLLAGSILVMAGGDSEDQRNARRFVDAQAATAIVTDLLKALTRQPRPARPDEKTGFPSGHASAAAAWAVCMAKAYPQWRWPAYGFAALVAWSRVDLRRHTTVQAVAGLALGAWLADRSWASRRGLFRGLIVKEGGGNGKAAISLADDAYGSRALDGTTPQSTGLSMSPDWINLTLWAKSW